LIHTSRERHVIAHEYFYKGFHSRGDDDYINQWAAEIDQLAAAGWEVLGSERMPAYPSNGPYVFTGPYRIDFC
jgi:hypothetical protein